MGIRVSRASYNGAGHGLEGDVSFTVYHSCVAYDSQGKRGALARCADAEALGRADMIICVGDGRASHPVAGEGGSAKVCR